VAKIPSSKFQTGKKKIVSAKFPKTKTKLSSKQLANQTSEIPSRKIAHAKKATKKVVDETVPLDPPSDEQARHEVLAILKNRLDSLKARGQTDDQTVTPAIK
jgi:hypothetical protein